MQCLQSVLTTTSAASTPGHNATVLHAAAKQHLVSDEQLPSLAHARMGGPGGPENCV